MKKIAILGCTGSIGRQTLDIVRSNPTEYQITGLSCGTNAVELSVIAQEFGCSLGIADKNKYAELKALCPDAEIFCEDDALTAVADYADVVVVAVVGMIGLKAVLYALGKGKTVALANKESLVAGGKLVTDALKRGGKLCPVDSEHSAVWQCLRGEKNLKRIILTASGGPFYFTDKSKLDSVTPEQAVAHPNWRMGKKISVDSATMMNKGLEIIEARWLFDTTAIDYVIHPESIVHSMVEFDDGSIKAQAGFPDMRLPIRYAIDYPEHSRRDYTPLKLPLELRFLPPDEDKFPAPALARYAIEKGGNTSIVINAANEAAVRLFLEGKIKFTDIIKIVEKAVRTEPFMQVKNEDDVYQTHNHVYSKIYLDNRG